MNMKCQKCGKELSGNLLGYYQKRDDPNDCLCHPCGITMFDEIREDYVEVINGKQKALSQKNNSLLSNSSESGNIWITIAKISVIVFIIASTVLGVFIAQLISSGAGLIGGIIGLFVGVLGSDILMIFVKIAEDISEIKNTAKQMHAKITKDMK